MSNQCYGCATPLKRSKKPEDCIKCHRMFCSGCLQVVNEVLASGQGKKHKPKICFQCSRADQESRKKQQEAETLQNLEKRYKERASEHSAKPVRRTNEDKELERRLKELKGSPRASPVPTVKALEQRLEKLKTDLSSSNSPDKENALPQGPSVDKNDLLFPTRKTEAEETQDLMKQVTDEAKVEEAGKAVDQELSKRLYNLKSNGQNPPVNIQPPPANMPSSTEEQSSEANPDAEVNNLINYAIEESKLEEQRRKENDAFIANCEARLHKLTDDASDITAKYSEEVRSKLPLDGNVKYKSPSAAHYSLNELSEQDIDEEVQKLVEQFAAEVELDKKNEQFLDNIGYDATSIPAAASNVYKPPQANDELPWCCICNDDATLRCYDCDDDLYCERCFRDGHQQFCLFDHKYVAFRPTQNSSTASNK